MEQTQKREESFFPEQALTDSPTHANEAHEHSDGPAVGEQKQRVKATLPVAGRSQKTGSWTNVIRATVGGGRAFRKRVRLFDGGAWFLDAKNIH